MIQLKIEVPTYVDIYIHVFVVVSKWECALESTFKNEFIIFLNFCTNNMSIFIIDSNVPFWLTVVGCNSVAV